MERQAFRVETFLPCKIDSIDCTIINISILGMAVKSKTSTFKSNTIYCEIEGYKVLGIIREIKAISINTFIVRIQFVNEDPIVKKIVMREQRCSRRHTKERGVINEEIK